MVERREDASRQVRWTAALDKPNQLVQIHGTLAGKRRRLLGRESGL